ncbi:putative Nodulation protein D 3 [Bradyrhizobium sp. ORS 375]|uniref:LysR family transcriptional regulator n=1 Tax=Bradyrhizobium sp. (strain ORS 375) TaxID=566679 RepID=UPI0002408096|nr:LysR family transcriptional regulator [Bradyrhizobium sp. ORS 375]CCD96072.1 putative Nodulation protein D 3 [Bradyrhizobium sp. ORS 375]
MRCHRLDLNLLLVLDLLLKMRNVSRVAETLNLTQSTISSALARLRSHFDDDLLIQSGREMLATPFAAQIAESVDQFVARARTIALARTEFTPETAEHDFSVVALDYVAGLLLSNLIRRVAHVAPGISISQLPLPESRERASVAQFDVFIGSNVPFDTAVNTSVLWEERFVPVVWAGNTAASAAVSLNAIATFTHVSVALDERLNVRIVDQFFQTMGISRTKTIRLQSLLLVPEFIVGTPYMAILPLRLVLSRARRLPLRILRTEFELPTITERLQWPVHLDKDPANKWLRDMIQASAAEVEARWSVSEPAGLLLS